LNAGSHLRESFRKWIEELNDEAGEEGCPFEIRDPVLEQKFAHAFRRTQPQDSICVVQEIRKKFEKVHTLSRYCVGW
jgi:hypothetical protein